MLLRGPAELAGELLAGQRDPDQHVGGPRAASLKNKQKREVNLKDTLTIILCVCLHVKNRFADPD